MSTVLFYTDPHLGLQRKANSTSASSEAREEFSRRLLLNCLSSVEHDEAICLGDLFDKTHNSEKVIMSGALLAENTDYILAGNHDVYNREGAVSSLDVVGELFPGRVIKGGVTHKDISNSRFYFVPHQLTQELFLAALDQAEESAKQDNSYRILCLHCNFDLTLEVSDDTLILPKERARELLGTFHYILLGHEHIPAEHFDGRLKILGSVYPTSIDEARAERRLWLYDAGTGSMQPSVATYDPAIDLWSGKASESPRPGAKFYVIEDDASEPGEVQKLAVSLFKEGAFAVKIVPKEGVKLFFSNDLVGRTTSLPDMIRDELCKELLSLWDELVTEAN